MESEKEKKVLFNCACSLFLGTISWMLDTTSRDF